MASHHIFLIDNSVSMQGEIYKMVKMLNDIISRLKKLRQEIFVSIGIFSNDLLWLIKGTHIREIKDVNAAQFINQSMTSLYDSVCQTLLEFGVVAKVKTFLYLITDGDDTSSMRYTKIDADKLCQTATTTGNWDIRHFNALDYQTLSVPTIKFEMDDLSDLVDKMSL